MILTTTNEWVIWVVHLEAFVKNADSFMNKDVTVHMSHCIIYSTNLLTNWIFAHKLHISGAQMHMRNQNKKNVLCKSLF